MQFAAVPWLRDYLNAQIAEVVDSADLDPAVLAQMLRNAVKRIVEGLGSNEEISHRRPGADARRSGRSSTGSPR